MKRILILGEVKIAWGGIAGTSDCPTFVNCVNYGEADSGISGAIRGGESSILNCCNLANCNDGLVGWFGGPDGHSDISHLTIKNSYNLGTASENGIIGEQVARDPMSILDIENCYSAGKSDKAIIGKIANDSDRVKTTVKNTYYEKSKSNSVGVELEGIESETIKDNADFIKKLNENVGTNEGWKHWKMGENGYPTFE